jgi:hypothetical protein
VRFELDGDRITLDAPPQMNQVVRSIPGLRWDSTRGVWTFPVSWATCVAARGVMGTALEVGPQLAEWSRQEHAARIAPCLQLRDAAEAPEPWASRIAAIEA